MVFSKNVSKDVEITYNIMLGEQKDAKFSKQNHLNFT